jgi:hypothetical protein
VKLSAQAEELEKSLECDSKIFVKKRILFTDLVKKGRFGCLAAFPGVWRPSYSLLGRISSTWASSLAVGTCIPVVAALFPSLAACCSLWA